jgi:DNA-binding transcriptional LysR family regulator
VHLETLRLYCDVVRLRSFSRGAQLNHISQSAASQAVQQVEADLGVALIDRTKRPFLVTPEGREFYDACRQVVEGYEKAKARIAVVQARLVGTVRVAAIYSVGLHDLSRHMQRFMALYPQARVQLECLHPHKVVDAVLNDSADVGIMSYPPVNRALAVVPLRAEPMALVCHPSHRFARRRAVAPEELGGEKFVAFDSGLTIRKAIDRALRHHNVKVEVVMEFDNIETIKQAITIGAGVSLLPRHTVVKEAGIRALAVVPLSVTDLVRPVGIIHRRHKRLTPTAARFIDLLRDAAANEAADEPFSANRPLARAAADRGDSLP